MAWLLNCNECFVFVDDERAHLIKTKKGSDGLWAELQQKRKEEQKQGEEFDNYLKKQEERSGWKKRGISKKRKAKEHEEMSSAKMLRKWLIVKWKCNKCPSHLIVIYVWAQGLYLYFTATSVVCFLRNFHQWQ